MILVTLVAKLWTTAVIFGMFLGVFFSAWTFVGEIRWHIRRVDDMPVFPWTNASLAAGLVTVAVMVYLLGGAG